MQIPGRSLHSIQILWAGGFRIYSLTNAMGEFFKKSELGTVAIWNTQKISNLKFATKGLLVPWYLLRNWGSTNIRTQGLHKDT